VNSGNCCGCVGPAGRMGMGTTEVGDLVASLV
jgi:hypothetical protein